MQLFRLIYTSVRSKHCTDKDIARIIYMSKRNNKAFNITGILLHTERRFIQALEGKKDDLLNLYGLISQDFRHTNVSIRYFNPTVVRNFPDWHMAYNDVTLEKISFLTSLSAVEKETYMSMIKGDFVNFDEIGMNILKQFVAINNQLIS